MLGDKEQKMHHEGCLARRGSEDLINYGTFLAAPHLRTAGSAARAALADGRFERVCRYTGISPALQRAGSVDRAFARSFPSSGRRIPKLWELRRRNILCSQRIPDLRNASAPSTLVYRVYDAALAAYLSDVPSRICVCAWPHNYSTVLG